MFIQQQRNFFALNFAVDFKTDYNVEIVKLMELMQEKMRGQRGRLRALAGICHVHESYF